MILYFTNSCTVQLTFCNSPDLSSQTLGSRSSKVIAQHSAQICTVNRAPNTQVHITSSQIDEAIRGVLEECYGSEQYCSGGQYAITADSGNVIDLSVQSLGQSCTA
jgi:hypothetical protein